MNKLLRNLALSSILFFSSPAIGADCSELQATCSKLVGAQKEEIQGLKQALQESRDQTNKATDVHKSDSGHGALIIGIIGVAAGVALGASLAK